jgi:hypothetical protein
MTKNPTFWFQYFLDRAIPTRNEGIWIAKNIALSFPDHNTIKLNSKNKNKLIKLIIEYY